MRRYSRTSRDAALALLALALSESGGPPPPGRFRRALAWLAERSPLSREADARLSEGIVTRAVRAVRSFFGNARSWLSGEIDRAEASGVPYAEFQDTLRGRLEARVGSASPDAALLYDANAHAAATRGRREALLEPDPEADDPEEVVYWQFVGVVDERQTDTCRSRSVPPVILPSTDPWWEENEPPLHARCRSGYVPVPPALARSLGISSAADLARIPRPERGWGSVDSLFDWEPDGDVPTPTPAQAEREARAAREMRREIAGGHDEEIRRVLDEWVVGSKRKTPVTLKRAVSEELGVSGIAYSRVNWNIKQGDVDAMRPAVRQLYEDTQADLRERYPSGTVRLYRGVKEGYSSVGILESWTTDRATARKFNGYDVIAEDVPIERVLAHHRGPHWRNGKFGEQYEYVVLSDAPGNGRKN